MSEKKDSVQPSSQKNSLKKTITANSTTSTYNNDDVGNNNIILCKGIGAHFPNTRRIIESSLNNEYSSDILNDSGILSCADISSSTDITDHPEKLEEKKAQNISETLKTGINVTCQQAKEAEHVNEDEMDDDNAGIDRSWQENLDDSEAVSTDVEELRRILFNRGSIVEKANGISPSPQKKSKTSQSKSSTENSRIHKAKDIVSPCDQWQGNGGDASRFQNVATSTRGDLVENDGVDGVPLGRKENQKYLKQIILRRRLRMAKHVEERMETASRRRQELQDERKHHLAEVSKQRQEKVEGTKKIRHDAMQKFFHEGLGPLNALHDTGLFNENISTDELEYLLMSDTRICDVCYPSNAAPSAQQSLDEGNGNNNGPKMLPAMCPVIHSPHRRFLVAHAEKLLKLIGNTKINLSSDIPNDTKMDRALFPPEESSPASSSAAVNHTLICPASASGKGFQFPTFSSSTTTTISSGGSLGTSHSSSHSAVPGPPPSFSSIPSTRPRNRVRRPISVIPQLLVLAFYNVKLQDAEVDPVLKECARVIIQTLKQLREGLLVWKERQKVNTTTTSHTENEQEQRGIDGSHSTTNLLDLETEDNFIKSLLTSFVNAWRSYVRLSDKQYPHTKKEADKATRDLLRETKTALKAAYQKLNELVLANQRQQHQQGLRENREGGGNGDEILGRARFFTPSRMLTTEDKGKRNKNNHNEETLLSEEEGVRSFEEIVAISSYISILRERLLRVEGNDVLERFDADMKTTMNYDINEINHLRGAMGVDSSTLSASLSATTSPNDNKVTGKVKAAISVPLITSTIPTETMTTAKWTEKKNGEGSVSIIDPSSSYSAALPAHERTISFPERHGGVLSEYESIAGGGATTDYYGATSGDDNDTLGNGRTSRSPFTFGVVDDQEQQKHHQRMASTASTISNAPAPPSTQQRQEQKLGQTRMGPELPPHWRVDTTGRSLPPSPEEARKAERDRLDYYGRAAYTAKMKQQAMKTQAEMEESLVIEQLKTQLDEQMWQDFKGELDQTDFSRVPGMLRKVSDILLDTLPRRIKPKVSQELRDVLDWDIIKHNTSGQNITSNIISFLTYLTHILANLGAPARENELRENSKKLSDKLLALSQCQTIATEDEGNAPVTFSGTIVEIFRFIFDIIFQLKKDIADFQFKMISSELADKVTKYERDFINFEFSDDSSQWTSSREFLKRGCLDADSMETVPLTTPGNSARQTINNNVVVLSQNGGAATVQRVVLNDAMPHCAVLYQEGSQEKKLFAGLLSGVVDLLRSGNRDFTTRWATYPRECLHFERPLLFQVADSVQLSSLRLMLVGTVSMLLSPLKIQQVALQKYLSSLDKKVLTWLQGTSDNNKGRQTSGNTNKNATSFTLQQQSENPENTSIFDEQDFSQIHTIIDLQHAMVESVETFLASNPPLAAVPVFHSSSSGGVQPPPTPPTPLIFSEANKSVLEGVINKMIDTNSAQYILFESRILRAVLCAALREIVTVASGLSTEYRRGGGESTREEASNVPSSLRREEETSIYSLQSSSSLTTSIVTRRAIEDACSNALKSTGVLVSAAAEGIGKTVGAVVLQNWEVYKPYYQRMMAENAGEGI